MGPREERLYISWLKPYGKNILDLGAHTGDSAMLFLKNGAQLVIAVEKDPKKVQKMPNDPHIIKLNMEAKIEHLESKTWDALKCDIEGYEMKFLDHFAKETRPVILESHNWYNTEKFLEIGYRCVTAPEPMIGQCLMAKNEVAWEQDE